MSPSPRLEVVTGLPLIPFFLGTGSGTTSIGSVITVVGTTVSVKKRCLAASCFPPVFLSFCCGRTRDLDFAFAGPASLLDKAETDFWGGDHFQNTFVFFYGGNLLWIL